MIRIGYSDYGIRKKKKKISFEIWIIAICGMDWEVGTPTPPPPILDVVMNVKVEPQP